MSTTATLVRNISLVCVSTIDQDSAIQFYESIGFAKRTDIAFGGKYRWVEVYPPEGATGIALAPPPDGKVEPAQTGITLVSGAIAAYGGGINDGPYYSGASGTASIVEFNSVNLTGGALIGGWKGDLRIDATDIKRLETQQ